MKKPDLKSGKDAVLRKQAEKKLKAHAKNLSGQKAGDVQQLIHELQVHQIELEMQNDELAAAQIQIEESRNRYADLYDFAPVGYFTFDKDGLILEANLTGAAQLGIERRLLIKKPFSRFIEKGSQDIFYLHRQKVLGENTRQACDLRLRKKDGSGFFGHLESISVVGPDEEKGLCRSVLSDITGRKMAEETISRVRKDWETTFNTMPDLVMILDNSNRIMRVNRATAEKFGLKPADIVGRKCYEFMHGSGKKLFSCPHAKMLTDGKEHTEEIFEERLGGHYLITVTPIFNTDGRIEGSVHVARDITGRKKDEEAFRQIKEDLQRAQEVGSVGNWRLDVRQNVLTWSDETYRIFGIPAGAPLTYETFLSVVHPYDREYVDAEWKAGLKGEPYDIEHRIVVDGQIKWVREKAYLEFDKEGELIGGFGITQDITKLKLSEERLIESQRFSRQIIESTPNIIFIVDIVDHYLVYANHQLGLVLGYTLEDIREMGDAVYQKLIDPEDLDKIHVHLNMLASVRDGDIVSVEARVRHADGKWRWILIRNIVFKRTEDGYVRQVLGTAENITARKTTEHELDKYREVLEEIVRERTAALVLSNEDLGQEIAEREKTYALLKESEKKFRKLSQEFNLLLDAIPYSIMLLTPDLKVQWANKGASEIIGRKQHEISENYCYELWHKDRTPCDECPAVISFNTGQQVSAQRKANNRFWEVKAFPLKGDEGSIPNVIMFTSDITEKITLQAEAMRAGHLASIGELASGVAHEINNPINGIINYAQILADSDRGSTQEKDIAKQIIEEGDRIARIVKSLLFFAHDSKENKVPVNVRQILSDSLALTSAQIRKDGIKLTVDFPHDLPEIIGHPQQIEQVFLNLINNARYALNQKYLQLNKDKNLRIYGEKVVVDQQEYVRIIFTDTGLGIPADIIGKVMNPFFTTKPAGKGTGLGLSISHGIISDHEGVLRVESIEGEFTSIIIDLPVKGYD